MNFVVLITKFYFKRPNLRFLLFYCVLSVPIDSLNLTGIIDSTAYEAIPKKWL